MFTSDAVKVYSRGRASGGLMLLIKSKYESSVNIINKSAYWLFISLKIDCRQFIIGIIYFKPDMDDILILNLFKTVLDDIISCYGCHNIILGGDFNSRISNLNNLDEEIFENSFLDPKRRSLDQKEDKRGGRLVQIMEELGLFVLNGRSCSDSPAKFTYIAPKGSSVIDLVWINPLTLSLVIDIKVINMFYSDHSLCQLNLSTDISSIVNQVKRPQSKFILKRNDSSKWDDYRKALSIVQWDTILLSKEVNTLSNNFITTLFQSLVAADILCSVSTKSVSNHIRISGFLKSVMMRKGKLKIFLCYVKRITLAVNHFRYFWRLKNIEI